MYSSNITNSKRTAAGIIGFLMLAVLLFSSFYIAAEAEHDCMGENCPVCICIRQCEHTLRQIGDKAALHSAVIVPAVLMLISAFLFAFAFSPETPVSRKVRLND